MQRKSKNSKSTVSSARSAAFDILLHVERDDSYAAELLHSSAHQQLSTPDHALATELVMGVLRWRSRLDDEIAHASSQPLARLDLEILIALRLGLYQLGWLDRIPQRAAIHESVELVKRARKSSATGFVNAVLRKLSARISTHLDNADTKNADSAETIAHAFAHPQWIITRWVSQYGLAATQRICDYDQRIPETAIRLRTPAAEAALQAQGITLAPGNFLSSARRVSHGDVTKSPAFRDGHAVIQDEASQLVAALIGNGTKFLDCCAAPGGKTLAMADANPNATIFAAELHPHRARLLKNLLSSKTHDSSRAKIHIAAADARALPYSSRFDCILVDAPCSGTGTLARNPEIKWRLQPSDLVELHSRQVDILHAALQHLAPRGRLLYSTCSLEKEENEDVIEKILRQNKTLQLLNCRDELDRLKSAGSLLWSDLENLTRGPYLRTVPGLHLCDGFFAAILEKN